MRKIRPSFPKRREMLATPFQPLTEEGFLRLVSDGLAIPAQQGNSLTVAKWKGGPGMNPQAFLAALRSQGRSLVVRRFKADVNVRVVRDKQAGDMLPAVPARRTSP
jgi:hypothetical protein